MTSVTRLTWVARVKRAHILPKLTRMSRLPRFGRLTGLTSLDILTILTRVISMERLTGKDRQDGLYRLTVTDTHTRLTSTVLRD